MNKTLKIFLMLVILLLIAGGAITGLIYTLFSRAFSGRDVVEIVEPLREPRTLVSQLSLEKSVFFKKSDGSFLSAFTNGATAASEDEKQRKINNSIAKGVYGFQDISLKDRNIMACGKFGCYEIDKDGTVKNEVLLQPFERTLKVLFWEKTVYESNFDNIKYVQLTQEKDGFTTCSSVEGFSVYDTTGNRIWNYGREEVDLSSLMKSEDEIDKELDSKKWVLNGTVADINGDNVGEYIVSVRNDGIHAFKNDGTEMWFQKEEYPDGNLFVDTFTGSSVPSIAQISSKIIMRNTENGSVSKIFEGMPGDISAISHDKNGVAKITTCSGYENKINCASTNGKDGFESEYPLSTVIKRPKRSENDYDYDENVFREKIQWIQDSSHNNKYLVVVAPFILIPRGILYVYTADGKLIYQEVMPEKTESLLLLSDGSETPSFLVGGKDTIWRYTLK